MRGTFSYPNTQIILPLSSHLIFNSYLEFQFSINIMKHIINYKVLINSNNCDKLHSSQLYQTTTLTKETNMKTLPLEKSR